MMHHEMGFVPQGPQKFEVTKWGVVLAAAKGSREALTTLCTLYWRPIYAFYRRDKNAEDALDLTQGFFARLLEKGDVAAADKDRGRFRNWLLKAAKNYRANDTKSKQAEKRGGGIPHLSIDAADAEERDRLDPAGELSPEQSYERSWARTLLKRVMDRLRDEHERRDQGPLFEQLSLCLSGDNEQKCWELAEKLGIEEGTFRQKVRRCKIRYGELLAEEVAATVSTDGDIEKELCYLREVLRAR